MFNFQGSEVIIILLLALVVLGPEKLPDAMRKLGRFYGDLKRMSTSFQDEFKAAVDEPMRELRDTANTLRDSVDFRKLQDGERDEKPKSAEMAPADPEAVPTEDVPFRDAPAGVPEPDAPVPADGAPAATDEPAEPAEQRPTPFGPSQRSSASAPRVDRPTPTATAVDDEHGLRESVPAPAESAAPVVAPQVAVDDEHGLREARPADPGDAA